MLAETRPLIVKPGCNSSTRLELEFASLVRPSRTKAAVSSHHGTLNLGFARVAVLAALAAPTQSPAKKWA